MSVHVTYECDGCDNKTEPVHLWCKTTRLNSSFVQRDYPQPRDAAPPGWIAYDPYTQCCYCPECSAKLFGEEAA